jgi:glycosyltransferase involved in cell wall biosynthesis
VRIAFDHQAFCLQKNGGISRYFFKLAETLATDGQAIRVFSPFHRNQYAKQLASGVVCGTYTNDYPNRCADVAVALNGLVARHQLRAWRPAIVHETYFSNYRSGGVTTPTVLTIFDMIGELGLDGLKPTKQELRTSKKYVAVKRADHIICISEHTRQDLIKLYDIEPAKTTTIHLGCDSYVRPTVRPMQIGRPYLLYVGLRGGYKNFDRFVQAVAFSKQLRESFDIVAFGGGAFSDAELAALRDLKFTPNQVVQVEGDDSTLANYYAHASALVYPSFYEGFGLPPLEAMAYRCPVVSSQATVMPEIIGSAAEFFDPIDLADMAVAIERVVFSPVRTQDLIEKGLEQVKYFTWDKCAQQHLDVYRALDRSISKTQ